MSSDSHPSFPTTKLIWAGRILSALPVLLLLASGTMKLMRPAPLVKSFVEEFGYTQSAIIGIGIAEIASTLLYAIPQTAVLGAILMTGFLGGATATHVRVGQPFFAPIIVGVVVWLGLYLRDERLRAMLPLRSVSAK